MCKEISSFFGTLFTASQCILTIYISASTIINNTINLLFPSLLLGSCLSTKHTIIIHFFQQVSHMLYHSVLVSASEVMTTNPVMTAANMVPQCNTSTHMFVDIDNEVWMLQA